MTSVSLGKIAFTWKGVYSNTTTYAKQDVVSLNGDSFVCIADGTVGVTPTASGTSWQLFAQGTQGVSSSAGEIIYNNGTSLVALPAGTAGQVLSINVLGFPEWTTPDVRSGVKVRKLPENSKQMQPNTYRRYGVIMTDNTVRCWGNNEQNMLGEGTTYNRQQVTRVAFPPSFAGAEKLVYTHQQSAYCIDKTGKLWGWGANAQGQLGTGNLVTQPVPYCISNNASNSIYGKTVTDVFVAGGVESYVCVLALCSDGTLHSCGYNAYGQLGLGDTTDRSNFNEVPIISGVVSVALGRERYTACYAVQSDGKLYSWGYNGDGQLGTGNTTQSNLPVQRTGGTLSGKTIKKVYGQYMAAFALDSTGALHAWGTNATYGNLGCSNFANQFTPVQVATSVADAYTHSYDYPLTLIKKTDGTLWAAGAGNYNANGDVGAAHSANWIQIPIGNTVVKALHGGTGSYNFCAALMTDGSVYTWGYNGNGVLGLGHTTTTYPPQKVPINNRTVVDIGCWCSSSEQNLAYQLDDGQLLVSGYGGSYSNTEVNSNYASTPMPVIF